MSQSQYNESVVSMLHELINGRPSALRESLNTYYEKIYLDAYTLMINDYFVMNGELRKHPTQWKRRVR